MFNKNDAYKLKRSCASGNSDVAHVNFSSPGMKASERFRSSPFLQRLNQNCYHHCFLTKIFILDLSWESCRYSLRGDFFTTSLVIICHIKNFNKLKVPIKATALRPAYGAYDEISIPYMKSIRFPPVLFKYPFYWYLTACAIKM